MCCIAHQKNVIRKIHKNLKISNLAYLERKKKKETLKNYVPHRTMSYKLIKLR